jgi:hypothetical protein
VYCGERGILGEIRALLKMKMAGAGIPRIKHAVNALGFHRADLAR